MEWLEIAQSLEGCTPLGPKILVQKSEKRRSAAPKIWKAPLRGAAQNLENRSLVLQKKTTPPQRAKDKTG